MSGVAISAVRESVTSAELDRAWQTCLESLEGYSPAEKNLFLTPLVSLREEFLRAMNAVQDEYEQVVVCAMFYIQLKSHWMLLNLHSGYLIREGQLDIEIICRSGLISALLDRVEKTLDPQHIHRITRFISQPLATEEEDELFPLSELKTPGTITEKVQMLLESGKTHPAGSGIAPSEEVLIRRLMEQQQALERMQRDREILEQEFGRVSAKQICELFANMRRSMSTLLDKLYDEQTAQSNADPNAPTLAEMQKRLEDLEAELVMHRQNEAYLRTELGTTDPVAIVAKARTGNSQGTMYDELNDVLGNLEKSMQFLN